MCQWVLAVLWSCFTFSIHILLCFLNFVRILRSHTVLAWEKIINIAYLVHNMRRKPSFMQRWRRLVRMLAFQVLSHTCTTYVFNICGTICCTFSRFPELFSSSLDSIVCLFVQNNFALSFNLITATFNLHSVQLSIFFKTI